jgi:hypothetical protein
MVLKAEQVANRPHPTFQEPPMRRVLLAMLTLTGIALTQAPAYGQRGREGDDQAARRNGWGFSLASGLRQAQETGKPLMVVLRCVP